jgi:hypothetical protein
MRAAMSADEAHLVARRAYQRAYRNREARRAYQRTPEARAKRARYEALPASKARRRRHRIAHRYGLTVEEVDTLLSSQDGMCACCHAELQPGHRTHIDHDHETGRIRGILCPKCNTGIGKLGDNEAGLLQALEYLRSPDAEATGE